MTHMPSCFEIWSSYLKYRYLPIVQARGNCYNVSCALQVSSMCVCMNVCVYGCVCVYMRVCVYMCVCVYMRVCVDIG